MIAIGVATAEMLGRGARGKSRFDETGDQYRLHRATHTTRVVRYKSETDALKLPGVTRSLLVEAQRRHPRYLELVRHRKVSTATNETTAGNQSATSSAEAEELVSAAMQCIRTQVDRLLNDVGRYVQLSSPTEDPARLALRWLEQELIRTVRSGTSRQKPALRLVVNNTRREVGHG